MRAVRIGTRGSILALKQAEWVKERLEGSFPLLHIDLVTIKTKGDRILDAPLASIGGKGLFVKEIEVALMEGKIDLAVHSMKDLPTGFPDLLHLGAVTKREDPRDVLISKGNCPLMELREGASVGTSSLRRQAQLLHIRPDLKITALRGNLDTRIEKLERGDLEAIVVAAAGLKRVGLEGRITEYLLPEKFLPAIGQGALAIESRKEDQEIDEIISCIDDRETFQCILAERALLSRLQGGCQVPIAAFARVEDDRLSIQGLVARLDGSKIVRDEIDGAIDESEALGTCLAEKLLEAGAKEILEELSGGKE